MSRGTSGKSVGASRDVLPDEEVSNLVHVGDQFGAHVIGHGLADDAAGAAITDGAQTHPALPGRQVSDVRCTCLKSCLRQQPRQPGVGVHSV